jgi:hypothetical protein
MREGAPILEMTFEVTYKTSERWAALKKDDGSRVDFARVENGLGRRGEEWNIRITREVQ